MGMDRVEEMVGASAQPATELLATHWWTATEFKNLGE